MSKKFKNVGTSIPLQNLLVHNRFTLVISKMYFDDVSSKWNFDEFWSLWALNSFNFNEIFLSSRMIIWNKFQFWLDWCDMKRETHFRSKSWRPTVSALQKFQRILRKMEATRQKRMKTTKDGQVIFYSKVYSISLSIRNRYNNAENRLY